MELEQIKVEIDKIAARFDELGTAYEKGINGRYIATRVRGLKVEYNAGTLPVAIKLLDPNQNEGLQEKLETWVIEGWGRESLVEKRKVATSVAVNFWPNLGADEYFEVLDRVGATDFGISFIESKKVEVGVLFEGTLWARTKERGATIGGPLGRMVAKASGMGEVWPEQYFSCGEIDGVEYDTKGNPISIYECQSGIHNGQFLDETHLNKALGKYLYDKEIIGTCRKVVILAGGYYTSDLNHIKERASELANRKNPIEVILLRTTRIDDIIGVERINF